MDTYYLVCDNNIWFLSWTPTHIANVHFSDITQKSLFYDRIIVNRQCKYVYLTLHIYTLAWTNVNN